MSAASRQAQLERASDIVLIQQLSFRYSLALDSRDIDMLVRLFVEDVQVDDERRGREELADFYRARWTGFRRSIHYVPNQVIDVQEDGRASGTVYQLGFQEGHDGTWSVLFLAYFDRYVRNDEGWLFSRRRPSFWMRERGLRLNPPDDSTEEWKGMLPDRWPSWGAFWARANSAPSPDAAAPQAAVDNV